MNYLYFTQWWWAEFENVEILGYNMKISENNSKAIAMRGKYMIQGKIAVNS
jgi:hypothetical protein